MITKIEDLSNKERMETAVRMLIYLKWVINHESNVRKNALYVIDWIIEALV